MKYLHTNSLQIIPLNRKTIALNRILLYFSVSCRFSRYSYSKLSNIISFWHYMNRFSIFMRDFFFYLLFGDSRKKTFIRIIYSTYTFVLLKKEIMHKLFPFKLVEIFGCFSSKIWHSISNSFL